MISRSFIAILGALTLMSCGEAANPSHHAASAFVLRTAAADSSVSQPLGVLPDFSALVEKEGRAVVNISTTKIIREARAFGDSAEGDPFEIFRYFGFPVPPRGMNPRRPHENRSQSLGSGFIVDPDGYILTNAHVVANADQIKVTLGDKREFIAKVIGSDLVTDVALLKIDATSLPTVLIGSSANVKVGEWVIAIGSPFGLDNTVTAGIVSAKGRDMRSENNESYLPFIQTDVAINPGSSGGPLFNVRGEVIGINAQIISTSTGGGYLGLSFAIPIDDAMRIAQQLKATGHVVRGRIGVIIQPITSDLAKDFGLKEVQGALVTDINADGPAQRAGIKVGDVIIGFNDQKIENSSDLPRLVAATAPGTKATITVWRNAKTRELPVVIEAMPTSTQGKLADASGRGKHPTDRLSYSGLTVRDVDPAALKQYGLKFALQVVDVKGPAAQANIIPGDLIVGIGNQDLHSYKQLNDSLAQLKGRGSIALRLLRGQQSLFVSLRLDDSVETQEAR